MENFWVVRADGWWYKFTDKALAQQHYKYILDNLNDKYKNIEKVYLAEYNKTTPKILNSGKEKISKLFYEIRLGYLDEPNKTPVITIFRSDFIGTSKNYFDFLIKNVSDLYLFNNKGD